MGAPELNVVERPPGYFLVSVGWAIGYEFPADKRLIFVDLT